MITFEYLTKCKQATAKTDFNCKLVLDKGLFAVLPDGFKIDLTGYSFMKVSTLTKWLNVLYLIRKDKTDNE